MGLIAGIYSKRFIPDIMDKLLNMIKAQSHRDNGIPEIYIQPGFAVCMSNQHDTIFTKHSSNLYYDFKTKDVNDKGIRAFIDGIVLDTESHANFFNKKGYKVSNPLCSTVLAVAYEEWGLGFMDHLEGEFAGSIVDENEKKIILVRDTIGKKPLHYFWDGTTFLFSSEIKGLIAGGAPAEIDSINLSDFLTLNCIPYPATIFKNIFQVPPGSMIVFNNNEIKNITYWRPQFNIDESVALDDIVEQITVATKNAVRKRMLSDDVYCFLSGGIDSSAVVSFASELSSKPIHTISVGFEEEEKNELEDAAIMAKHVGAVHHQVIASPDSFFDMLDTLVFNQDSPFSDISAYPTFFAGKLASKFTDLILTGDGPDQTMGGSGHHVFAVKHDLFSKRNSQKQLFAKYSSQLLSQMTKDPSPTFISKVQRNLYRNSISPVHAAYDLRSYFPDIVKQFLCTDDLWEVHKKNNPYRHPESWFKEAGNVDDINKYLYADRK
ncbi:MAG: 7-cyano-7-deazaguanine synthase, partial [Desulfobacteraceae bacterium]|nr:7-cyano-7-deazaguanine synthase [Desulfobacteraceae bacterium]